LAALLAVRSVPSGLRRIILALHVFEERVVAYQRERIGKGRLADSDILKTRRAARIAL
jgi:hypothetical protein